MNEMEIIDVVPEGPGTEIATITNTGDPEAMLAILEKKAKLAPRILAATNTILVAATHPEDWTEQGGKMCLSSAGAERVATMFSIRFHDHKWLKEEFRDEHGQAYRYVYECTASLGDREVFAQGTYSTRDKFLGYNSGKWRPVEDINENSIRSAAYHICQGNAIKALLGLRGIPADRFAEMMSNTGRDASKAATVRRGKGTSGGTSTDDSAMQKQLAEICIYIASGGFTVVKNDKGYCDLVEMGESDDRESVERAKEICEIVSSFIGKGGEVVNGLPASKLRGKRLEISLSTAKKIKTALNEKFDGGVS